MSDILPDCFGLGGCQPQFCTSLQAQFDVVWITFRHTHTPSLAFIQGSNAGHPLCSEGGIWQGPNTPGKKTLSYSIPSCLSNVVVHHAIKNSLCFVRNVFNRSWLLDIEGTRLFPYSKQQLHLSTVKLLINAIVKTINIEVFDVMHLGKSVWSCN